MRECLAVLHKVVEIELVGLRDNAVKEFASHVTASGDEYLVCGRDNYERYATYVFGKGFVGFLLVTHLLGLVAPLYARNLNGLVFKPLIASVNGEELLSFPNVLSVDRVEVTLAEREVIDGIEEVGLPHSVVADETVDSGAEIDVGVGVGLEIGYFKIGEMQEINFEF